MLVAVVEKPANIDLGKHGEIMADELNPNEIEGIDSEFLSDSGETTSSAAAPVPETPTETPSPIPPTPTEPTAPSTPPTDGAQPTAKEITDALEQARQLGVDVTQFSDGASLVRGMYQAVQNMQPYARLGQQAAAEWDEYQEWKSGRQQAAPVAPAAKEGEFDLDAHFREAWGVPDWKQEWTAAETRGMVRKDEAGNWVPAPGHEAAAAAVAYQMNDHDAARAQAIEGLFVKGNPFKTFHAKLQPVIERQVQEAAARLIEERFAQQQYDQYVAQLTAEFTPYRETPWGQAVLAHVNMLEQNGMRDPQRVYETALKLAGPRPDQQAPAKPAAPAATAAPTPAAEPVATPDQQLPPLPVGYSYSIRDQQGRLLSAEQAAALQKQSFLDKAARASHTPGTANTPADMRTVSEAEMNNFFLGSAS
jgi:hypothetical protein